MASARKRRQAAGLESLSEDALRKTVLIPLFQAMGFRDVTERHGRSELGKDIVMWYLGPLGVRENYAVVAKAGPISGKAAARPGSASTTVTQIMQAFGAPFLDPVTGSPQEVKECWVVASGSIKHDALAAMMAQLKTSGVPTNCVQFIHGERLRELYEKHLPTMTAAAKAQELKDLLERASESCKIAAAIDESGTRFIVSPRPGVSPPLVRMLLDFPETPEGQTAKAEWLRHVETGAPVSIPGTYIKDLQLPITLSLLGPGSELAALQLGPAVPNAPPVSLIVKAQIPGRRLETAPIRFRWAQHGTKELTLKSMDGGPLSITLCLRFDAGMLDLNIRINPAGHNAREALEALRLQSMLAKGAEIAFLDAASRLVAFESETRAYGAFEVPASQIELAELVLSIQERCGVPILLPDRDISAEEVEAILLTATDVTSGARQAIWEADALLLGRPIAEEFLERFADGAVWPVRWAQPERRTILGTSVDLGIRETILRSARMSPRDHEALGAALSNPADSQFAVVLTPADSQEAILRWPRFLAAEDEGSSPGPDPRWPV